MVKAIIFDLFGVLYVDPMQHAIDMLMREHKLQDRQELEELRKASDHGLITEMEFEEGLQQLLGKDYEAWLDDFVAAKREGVNTALLDLIRDLKPHYKIGVLSNVGKGVIRQFIAGDYERYFDAALGSGDIGHTKPSPEAFKAILEKLDVEPSEAIFTDDSQLNVNGAKQLGIQAFLFKSYGQLAAELESLGVTRGNSGASE